MFLYFNTRLSEKEAYSLYKHCEKHRVELAVMFGAREDTFLDESTDPSRIIRIGARGFYLMEQSGKEGVWEIGIYNKRKLEFFETVPSLEEALNSL